MSINLPTRARGRHRAANPADMQREIARLRAENRDLTCAVSRAAIRIAGLEERNALLTGQLKTQAGKVVRAQADMRRLAASLKTTQQRLADAQPRITQIDYPARVPMYATDGKGLPIAFCPYPDPSAFRSLDRPPVAVHDPEATQPIAKVTLPDGETTATLPRVTAA